MEKRQRFYWKGSVSTPRNYPIEVHTGYLATATQFIMPMAKTGVENSGWGFDGEDLFGGSIIPSQLSLTWVSYAEKKFWKVDATLDSAKMLTLFQEGFMYSDDRDSTYHITYSGITIGVAPGGIVVVWVVGDTRRREVGRYQAVETFVDVNDFYANADEDTQQEFFDWWFENGVPQETQELIKTKGIPYGLWDRYRQRYNWNFKVLFYNDDKEAPYRHVRYFNGEEDMLLGAELNQVVNRALPWRASFYFNDNWAEAEFDDMELMAAFERVAGPDKTNPIIITAKIGFMYDSLTFTVTSGDKSVPLHKVKSAFWAN